MKLIYKLTAVIAMTTGSALVGPGPASASSGRAPAQTFVLYGQGSSFHHPISVFAAGPILGAGSFEIGPERSSEGRDDFTATLAFPGRGTVTTEVLGQNTLAFDPTTCRGSQTSSFHWVITGGTGEFENASGSGTGTYTGRFLVERGPNGCVEDEAVISVFLARLSGTASVPVSSAA